VRKEVNEIIIASLNRTIVIRKFKNRLGRVFRKSNQGLVNKIKKLRNIVNNSHDFNNTTFTLIKDLQGRFAKALNKLKRV